MRELTRKHDVLLIADEVAVGFGRTGRMFACEHEGVTPDLFCIAKGLTGGYLPMAATLATEEIWQAFLGDYASGRTFYHGHTYGGNPLAAAAAMATLDVFEEERTLEHLQEKIARLRELLAPLAEHPHVGHIRQCGLIAGIELVRDRATREPYPAAERIGRRVCEAALRQGVLLRPLGDVIVLWPPLAISLEQLARSSRRLIAGSRKCQRKNLPATTSNSSRPAALPPGRTISPAAIRNRADLSAEKRIVGTNFRPFIGGRVSPCACGSWARCTTPAARLPGSSRATCGPSLASVLPLERISTAKSGTTA